nr:hypothetical protein [Tanacetum cinerariifolium]
VPTYEYDEEIPWKSSDEDDDDDVQQSEHDKDIDDQSDDESYDDQEDDDDQDDEDDNQTNSDNNGDDFVHPKFSTHDEEAKDKKSFDPIVQTPSHMENSDDESNDDANHDVHTTQVLEDTHVTLTLVNPDGQQQSSSVSSQFVTSMFNPSPDAGIDSLFKSTPRVDVLVMTTVVPLLVTAPTLPPPSIPIMS